MKLVKTAVYMQTAVSTRHIYAIYAFQPSHVHGDVNVFMLQRQPPPASLYDSGLEVLQHARMCEKQVAAIIYWHEA